MVANIDRMVVLANEPAVPFAEEVCESIRREFPSEKRYGFELGRLKKEKKFADKEWNIQIEPNVRKKDVFLIHAFPNPNDYLIELLLINDALKRASANEITNVLPYMPYTRQDTKDCPRVPISARAMADWLQTSGVKRIVTVDLHAGQIQGFYDIPVDNLYAEDILFEYLKTKYADKIDKMVPVAPDAGAAKRTRAIAEMIGTELVILDKNRPKQGEAEIVKVIGTVKGKYALIIDDLIDSGGTLVAAANALRDSGAVGVYAMATHAVFSRKKGIPAEDKLKSIEKTLVTDTIYRKLLPKHIEAVSISDLVGKAIYQIQTGGSVSQFF